MIDIHKSLTNTTYLLYADDLKLYKEIVDERDVEGLQESLDALVQWSKDNKIPLNVQKCKAISISRRKQQIEIIYKIGGASLEKVKSIRDLGVILQDDLNYNQQIQKITNNANRNMGMVIRHSKNFKNTESLLVLFYALVRSHLDFVSTIWHPKKKTHIKSLERIQKRFLRFLYFRDFGYYDYSISYSELVLGYRLISLEVRRDLALMLLLRDILTNEFESPYLLEKINIYAPSRNYRTQDLFQVATYRTEQGGSLPLNRCMGLYNKLIYLDPKIDIFFESRVQYRRRAVDALITFHSEGR